MIGEMLRDVWNDIFSVHSSFADRFLAILLLLVTFGTAGLFVFAIFISINSVGITPSKTVITVVETKEFVPARTIYGMVPVGKAIVPTMSRRSDSYEIHFKINGHSIESAVEEEFFKNLEVGDKIEVSYGFGRLTGSYEPVVIRPAGDKQ